MPPRRSLKKHDAAAESHTLKTRRQRTTTQVRKDKRHTAVQIKRRRLVSTSSQPALSGRSIAELIGCLGDAHNASTVTVEERFEALIEMRGLLGVTQEKKDGEHDKIEQLIESGIVPVLVSLLNSAAPLLSATRLDAEVYQEVLWCLSNIASGSYDETKLVLPAVPRLVQFLESSNQSLAGHAAWIIGNIAADCREFRQHLIANGVVAPLVKQLSNFKEAASTSAWALSNLARGFETPARPFVEAGIVSVLVKGLAPPRSSASFSDEVVVEVAWLLSFLTAREEEYLRLMLETGLVEFLLPYFSTSDEALLTPILRVFGNVCCGSLDHHTDGWQLPYVHRLLTAESVAFLPKLCGFLQQAGAQQTTLAVEAAWVVSNLAAAEAAIVDQLLQAQVLPLLGRQFVEGSYDVRREVAFALTNIALTSAAHLEDVLALDVVKGFLHLLTVADVAVVGNALRFIENVLRVASQGVSLVELNEGIDALETVQFECGEERLSQWAAALVNEFYGENYGVHSPPNADTECAGFGELSEEPMQLSFDVSQQSSAPGTAGRGRGAHMTTPAWKT
uniref:Importin subunit alpha n=1 Tax=Peronospora matthiolae TaxID=2874970 RepID=A0AAV1TQR2_9STRA